MSSSVNVKPNIQEKSTCDRFRSVKNLKLDEWTFTLFLFLFSFSIIIGKLCLNYYGESLSQSSYNLQYYTLHLRNKIEISCNLIIFVYIFYVNKISLD